MFDWVTSVVEQGGYIGIFLLMFAENVFPPLPSEIIMPLAGFVAARGELNLIGVVLAGTAGSLLGAILWFYIGRWLGLDRLKRMAARHGRWLTVSPADIDRANAWFERHGGKAVFFGRLIPTVRTLISVPAGVSNMALKPFLAYTALGTALWTAFLAVAGYLLETQYTLVADYVGPVAKAVVVLIVLCYVYRVITFRRQA